MPDEPATTTPAPGKLDEASLRRTPFLGSEGITLSDGQVWFFPRPVLEFAPRFGDAISAGVTTSLGPEFDAASERYDRACEAANSDAELAIGERPLDCMMGVAVVLLRIAYTLTDDQLRVILRWRPDDQESTDRWTAITNVARGVGPKPLADG